MSCKALIDELACCGHGDCALVAPHAFRVDDIAVATGEGTHAELEAAAAACPAGAITIVEE